MTTSPWFTAKQVKVAAAIGSMPLPPPGKAMAWICPYDRELPARVTAADGDIAANSGLTAKPTGAVMAQVNGTTVSVGNGVATGCCVWFGPSASAAKTFAQLQPGDVPRWNGSVAGFQLTTSDRLSLIYEVSS